MYKHADGLIANSHGTKNYLCNEWGLDEKNIHVIQNGVQSNEITLLAKDDSLFEWYKESLPIIITIGRLSPQKNHACLIKAFSIVRERMQSRLVIIGEGPLRQSLEELARIVCVAEDTWFAGYQNNPYKFLARSTVFVLPSKWEGFPNVLLEAMVCRVPVISTDIDFGPGEMIDHGKTGFLVPNNDPETLAAQIQYVLENRSGTAIKGIISNARKKVETEFSLEVMVKKYQEYFTDVYNSHYAWLH
jgi:glycosyltransferase involved in cell wall biosynthesis